MKKIPLTQNKFALVSDQDYERLNRHKWYAHYDRGNWYAARNTTVNGKRRTVLMHRDILGLTDPKVHTDHKDGNGLHNYRSNLRHATNEQNRRNQRTPKNNSTGYKGVSWHKQREKYYAGIKLNRKRIHLGYYVDLKEAACAYNQAARQYHGSFARLNPVECA